MLALALLKWAGVPSELSGGTPFPHLADWRADAALFASQALRARLHEDPNDAGLVDDLLSQSASAWQRSLLSPQVFAFLSNEPRRWQWSELADALRLDGLPQPAGGVLLYRQPGDLLSELLRKLGRGSRRADCADASFLQPTDPLFRLYASRLKEATYLIQEATPGFVADMASMVHAVALVDDKASFRGSSGVIHRGLIFLSPSEDWTPAVFAEELVHETTHNLIDVLALRRAMLVGEDVFEEKHPAPFRPDKRHVYGNFHAIIVVSRLLWLFDAFRKMGIGAPGHWESRMEEYARRSEGALQSVLNHGGLSPIGRFLIENLAVPTIQPLAGGC